MKKIKPFDENLKVKIFSGWVRVKKHFLISRDALNRCWRTKNDTSDIWDKISFSSIHREFESFVFYHENLLLTFFNEEKTRKMKRFLSSRSKNWSKKRPDRIIGDLITSVCLVQYANECSTIQRIDYIIGTTNKKALRISISQRINFFSSFSRKCGDGICENCSPNRRPVPERDWLTAVRVCTRCEQSIDSFEENFSTNFIWKFAESSFFSFYLKNFVSLLLCRYLII